MMRRTFSIFGPTARQVSLLLVTVLWDIMGVYFLLTPKAGAKTYPVLPACSRFEYNIFSSIDFMDIGGGEATLRGANELDEWARKFHGTVNALIEEDIGRLTDVDHSPLRRITPPPKCTAATYPELFPPRPLLYRVACGLPSWMGWDCEDADGDGIMNGEDSDIDGDGIPNVTDTDDDGDGTPDVTDSNEYEYNPLERLTQLDMGTVLLEFLRMYECALTERSVFTEVHTLYQETARQNALEFFGFSAPTQWLIRDIPTLSESEFTEQKRALTLSRRTVERAINFVGGFERLRPVDIELTCIQQMSVDIRNGMALGADASSCLPRVWNIKDPLRDRE